MVRRAVEAPVPSRDYRVALAVSTIRRSRHARRRVPTNRSATAFARGARTGVKTVSIPDRLARRLLAARVGGTSDGA